MNPVMQKRFISAFILFVYSAILIRLVVFKNILIKIGPLRFRFTGRVTGRANFLPFRSILPYLLGEYGRMPAIMNLIGNIALFVPIGFLAPFVWQEMTWRESLVLGTAIGLTVEGMEAMFRVGIFDIDDIMLNAFGVMIGYWAFTIFVKRMRSLKALPGCCS